MTLVEIVFPAQLWHQLRNQQIPGWETEWVTRPENENFAFVLAGASSTADRVRLLAREIVPALPADLLRQSPGGITPRPEFVAATLSRCRKEGWHLIETHSHPFDEAPTTTFSSLDWAVDRRKMPPVARLLPHTQLHVTMVMGRRSLDAHYYDHATGAINPASRVEVLGVDGKDWKPRRLIPTTSPESPDGHGEVASQYHRQERLLGRAGQQILGRTTVAIIGLGGLGSFAAIQLAHLGIGKLLLIDPDRVEVTNLNRLQGATVEDVGRTKVDVFAELVRRISPLTQVSPVSMSILEDEAQSAAKGADLLLGCVDSHGARLVLNRFAVRHLLPYIDAGTGVRLASSDQSLAVGGQVQVVVPGTGCLACRGSIDASRAAYDLASPEQQKYEREHGYGIEEPAPSVIFLNGVVASLQIAEAIFMLTGVQAGARTTTTLYDALKRRVTPASTSAYSLCLTCGEEGIQGEGDRELDSGSQRSEIVPRRRATDEPHF